MNGYENIANPSEYLVKKMCLFPKILLALYKSASKGKTNDSKKRGSSKSPPRQRNYSS